MTSRNKVLIAAAAFLVLLIGGYIGARVYRNVQAAKSSGEISYTDDRIKLDVPERDDIVKIRVPSTGVQLEKNGDIWETLPASSIRLDQSAISSVLWSLGYMYADRIIDEAPANLADYGLDNPLSSIITGADGKEAELLRGNKTPSASGYYVMIKGDPKVYLLSLYTAERLILAMEDIRDRVISSTFEMTEFRRFFLETGEFRVDVVPREEQSGLISELFAYVLTSPYVIPREVDSERFSALFEALQNIQIVDFIDDAPPSLEPYGLDKPIRVFLETESASLDLILGNSVDNRQYAKLPGESGVFTINDLGSQVRVSPFEMAGKFAFIVNIKNVDSLTVRGNGPPLNVEIRRPDEETEIYFLNGRQAAEKEFKALYQTLIGLMVDAEYPNRPARGGNEEITIEYHLNTPAGLTVEVKLIPYNRDFYALDRDGVVEFLVSRPQVAAIYQAAESMVYLE
ncbi:MAG: DUF4340 domain-containing protein [Treponema sp.]|jgi:hypothetical protein|nr:DUF4340 domain-containing protein [Treponema sp.]